MLFFRTLLRGSILHNMTSRNPYATVVTQREQPSARSRWWLKVLLLFHAVEFVLAIIEVPHFLEVSHMPLVWLIVSAVEGGLLLLTILDAWRKRKTWPIYLLHITTLVAWTLIQVCLFAVFYATYDGQDPYSPATTAKVINWKMVVIFPAFKVLVVLRDFLDLLWLSPKQIE